MKSVVLLPFVLLAATSGCGMLIGIEELHPGDAAGGPGGTSGADASTDRNASGGAAGAGTGGSGGATGGMGGASGTGPDATLDQANDMSAPGADVASDGRVDTSADARLTDADAATTPDTLTPETGAPDMNLGDASDATIAPDAPDAQDGGSADISVADTGTTDAGTPDTGASDTTFIDNTTTTITVNGRIIDYWKHGLPNVPVTIGGEATTTDSSGQFMVPNVTQPYDVLFTISTTQNNTPAKYGWLYKGLTRTDPTLQVGRGLPERSASTFNVHVSNIDFTNLPATETVHTSFGGVDGIFDTDIDLADNGLLQSPWYGPTTTSMNGHGLHWVRASSTTLDLPTSYLGYNAQTAALTDSVVSSVSFDMANTTVASGTITGSVTASLSGGQRENNVFVRFSDNAVIQIAQDSSQPTTFSYLVPSLPQGSITVAASQGDWYSAPYAVAHKDGLSAGQTGVALTIPDASSLIAPSAGATGVNLTTLFRWSGTAKVFTWAVSFTNEYKGFFVVTTEKQGQIATMPDGPALTPNAPYTWWVETNGSYQSVDEATGPDGHLDTFRLGVLGGAVRGDGFFTSSEEISFTTPP